MSDQTDADREIAELRTRLETLEAARRAAPADPEPPIPPPSTRPAPRRKKPAIAAGTYFGLVVFGVLVAAVIMSARSPPSAPASLAAPATTSGGINVPASSFHPGEKLVGLPDDGAWHYSSQADQLRGRTISFACTTSTNLAQLDWPYHPVSADLCLRRKGKGATEAYIMLNGDGQILCRSYDGCSVPIRFGSAGTAHFEGGSPSDGTSNTIFIEGASTFAARAKHAAQTIVELEFYQAGSQQLTFDTAKLRWP